MLRACQEELLIQCITWYRLRVQGTGKDLNITGCWHSINEAQGTAGKLLTHSSPGLVRLMFLPSQWQLTGHIWSICSRGVGLLELLINLSTFVSFPGISYNNCSVSNLNMYLWYLDVMLCLRLPTVFLIGHTPILKWRLLPPCHTYQQGAYMKAQFPPNTRTGDDARAQTIFINKL